MIPRRYRNALAVLAVGAALALVAPTAQAAFGIAPGSFLAKTHGTVPLKTIPGTSPAYQREADLPAIQAAPWATAAGAHPDATASFSLNLDGNQPDGRAKDIRVDVPPGLVGNPQAVPACSLNDFYIATQAVQVGGCPPASQVGVATIELLNPPVQVRPVYRITTLFGRPASFGFVSQLKPIILTPRLRSDGDFGLTVAANNITNILPLKGATVTLWGVPGSSVHDLERWDPESHDWGVVSGLGSRPFLNNPTYCDSGSLTTKIETDSWQEPGHFLPAVPSDPTYIAIAPSPSDCTPLAFGGPTAEASLSFQSSSRNADTPAGYGVKLRLPYNENPEGRANPTLRDTKVVLPEGVALNAAAANGLAACTESQIGYLGNSFSLPNPIHFNENPISCPDASKIGTAEVVSPLLEAPLHGAVYLAKQHENPFGSLLAIYIAIDDAKTGIVVKLAGHVEADPTTGRITATFTNNPQLPFTEFKLDFFGGPGASLVNPLTCGTKTTSTVLTPWSAPHTPPVTSTDSFDITSGANGDQCPASEAQAPNVPAFEAGTTFTNAGLYSPFVLKLSREDGSQRLTGLDLSLPPGLTGKIAGVPYCSEAQIAQARSRNRPGDGAAELASPSCPAASQIGTVNVGAGAGSQPYYVQGKAYLAGPYKGAPLSMVIVTPAVAGPFDLGVVTVRTALYVDQRTARISAKSDPLPTILEGIPLDIRSIAVQLDHPGGFTRNPTSCEAMSITGQATSTTGNVAQLNNRFQVGGCAGLDFKPKLKLRLKGATKRTGHPALKAVVTYPKHGTYANIARAQVGLPHSEFLDQGNLDKVCKQADLHAGTCPKRSVYGWAKAWTPLLSKPLQGPVYLGVGFGYKLPALVADLNGQIRILLVGRVDTTRHKGIRNTFEVVPDAPVSRFVLRMKGGKRYGLLTNSENICKKTQRASALFSAQNGARLHLRPKIHNSCKHRKRRKKQRAHARASTRRHAAHRPQGRS